MEDRYLFKARSVYEINEWVVGYYIVFNGKDSIFEKKPEKYYSIEAAETSCGNRITEVIPETVCQCTGLVDKNGKLIWENDIVAYWDAYSTDNGQAEADCIGKVVWDDETISFQVTNRLSAESYEALDECSVIGNAIDNPELLDV